MPLLETFQTSPYNVEDDDTIIGVWKISEQLSELADSFPKGQEYMRMTQSLFSSQKRRLEWLAVRSLLYHLTESDEEEIAYEANGKPFLRNSDRHISISHTNGFAALAIASHKIGVDIERISDRPWNLRHSFLIPDEIQMMSMLGNERMCALRLWSAKEAAFKLRSSEGIEFLNQIRWSSAHPFENGRVRMDMVFTDGVTLPVETFLMSDFVFSVCGYADNGMSGQYSLKQFQLSLY